MADKNTVAEPANAEILGVRQMNIYEKLSAISIEITNVNKNLNVGVGGGSYKAVSEADVLAAVKPAEAKYRVYSYPAAREVIETGTIESFTSKGDVQKKLFERIKTTYRFVNMDKPDEFVDIISYGDGIDSQDKSVGKGMTYADKYALLKAYKIITGEDPDQDPSDPLANRQTRAPQATQTRSTTRGQVKKGVSPEVAKECEELGVTLEQIANKKNMKVEDLTDEIVRPGLMILKKRKENPQPQTDVVINNKLDTVPNGNE